MGNMRNIHTTTGSTRPTLDGPNFHRPGSRSDDNRPPVRLIEEVLVELSGARQRLEQLRLEAGSLSERARLISQLHNLRAEAAITRSLLER